MISPARLRQHGHIVRFAGKWWKGPRARALGSGGYYSWETNYSGSAHRKRTSIGAGRLEQAPVVEADAPAAFQE